MGAKVFAVPFPLQSEQIKAWCWGEGCGKGSIGAMVLDGNELLPCTVVECPHLDRQMDRPFGTLDDGSEVYLRKLKEVG